MLADLFFAPPGDSPANRHSREAQAADVRVLREAIDRLREVAWEAGPEQLVEFSEIREHILGALNTTEQRGGFLTGGVTFCALKPMRSIPARVVWLLGMNDDAFPRKAQPPQFDLIAAAPKLGDRSIRDDDRYLFLEALLSARDRCFISYVGRSALNREEYPPSVVVSELLDYLDQCCRFPAQAKDAREWLTFEHYLHAFNRAYFKPGARLFSYSAANYAAATVHEYGRRQPPLLSAPLAAVADSNVELAALIRFFDNPAAAFLRERLGVYMEKDEPALAECEPMEVDQLERYQVCKEMLDAEAANNASPSEEAFTARALLPAGSVGAQHYGGLRRKTEALYESVRELLGATGRDAPRTIDLRIGDFTVTGRLEALYSGRLAFFRPADIKPKDRTRAWIQHLAWCAESPAPPPPTLLAGNEEALLFPALTREESEAQLLELLKIYQSGRQRPLPFFPQSALELVTPRKSNVPPIQRAREKWRGGFVEGEQEDPAYRICFGDRDPLDAEFEALATAIFGGMKTEKVE